MIKINLLRNDLSTPATRDRTGELLMPASNKTISQEAKKSYRRFIMLVIFLIVFIGGSIYGYLERYAVVAFVEQYTGPLNILPPQETGPSAAELEEQRRERIRQLYMSNTVNVQTRDFQLLKTIDSLNTVSKNLWITTLQLEGNDNTFNMEIYGKTEKDIAQFTKDIKGVGVIESIRPQANKPGTAVPGFRFKTVIFGNLYPAPSADKDTALMKPNYLSVPEVKKAMIQLSKKHKLKMTEEGSMNETRGVVMITHKGQFRVEGNYSDFLKYVKELNRLSLNMEWTKYNASYTAQKDKKNPKPDILLLEYNVLSPVQLADSSKQTSGQSNP